MKKYTLGFLLVAVTSLLAAILFTNSFEPIDTLMKPPKLTGDNLSIQLAFEKAVGENYILKSPIKGKYRSAFTFIDLTGDKDEEAVVFYGPGEEIGIVRMNVLDKVDGNWVSIADFESVYNEIQQIEFVDLNKDGIIEIIVGWATYQNDISKKLNIYQIETSGNNSVSINNIFEDDYSEFYIYDLDGDKISDILNLKNRAKGASTEYVACFMKYGIHGVFEQGSIPLDMSIATVKSSVSDKVNGIVRVFIDGYRVDSGMATDCIYWDNNEKLFSRLMVENQSIASLTSRNTFVLSTDIDSDNIIELPLEEKIPASLVTTSDRAVSGEQALTKWVTIDNSTVVTEKYQIINQNSGYCFDFNKSWLGRVTVTHHANDGVMTFFELTEEDGVLTSGQALFSIKTINVYPEDTDFLTYYKYLGENKGNYYYYRIFSAGEKLGIKRSTITKNMKYS